MYRLLPALVLFLLLRPAAAAAEVGPAPERRYAAASTLGDDFARSPGSAELRYRDGGRTADRAGDADGYPSAPCTLPAASAHTPVVPSPGPGTEAVRPFAERLPYHATAPPSLA